MAAIDPGDRDRLVTVQGVTDSVDASSFPVETWADIAAIWMSKRDLSGRERFAASQTSAAADLVFELPWRDDMDPESLDLAKVRRLVFRNRVYDIVRAEMRGRREGVSLYCLAKVG
jgi:SPP1 family predicted phage head-tail adaptor